MNADSTIFTTVATCLFVLFIVSSSSAKPLNHADDQDRRTVDALNGGNILERNLLSRDLLDRILSTRTVDSLDGDLLLRHAELDPISGGDLLFYLQNLHNAGPNHLMSARRQLGQRNLDTLNGLSFGSQKKRLDTLNGMSFGTQKRNFDEIDRAGFGGFMKRNFDEIDKAGFGGLFKRDNSVARSKTH
ncbi:Uncharacterised protein g9555 [Pycnogonum litorale]